MGFLCYGGEAIQNDSGRRNIMPYILGWFLGVPLVVLVLLYLLFH
jgi:hypothetical protein